MLKHIKKMTTFCVIVSFFISCSKDVEPVLPSEPDNIEIHTPPSDEIVGETPVNPETPETPSEPGTPETPVETPETPAETPETPTETPEAPAETPGTPSQPLTPIGPGTPVGKPENNPVNPPVQTEQGHSVEVGNGSGDLTIDGNDAKVKGKSLITIKSGTYGYIKVQNIHGSTNAPVFIKNAGQVTVRGGMETKDITNVTIAGDNVPGLTYGFNFQDVSFRALTLSGKMTGVTLKNLSFKNVKDYVIFADLSNLRHNGSSDSRVERFKILNSKFDNAANIEFKGNFGSGSDNGLIKDLEIAHNTIVNNNGGNFAYFANVQDYNIHHNVADNINPTQNQHNGIFHMIGNGKFHNNKFTNYQGNMIRAWVFSRGSSPATVEIYNNIAYNTRKYSAFEIQGFDKYIVSGKSTYVNAKVYNNTVGKMNTSKDWDGVVLDLYNFGGTLEYYNNLGYELVQEKGITDMINNMSSTKITKNTNNKYLKTAAEAVSGNFVSKHPGIGAN